MEKLKILLILVLAGMAFGSIDIIDEFAPYNSAFDIIVQFENIGTINGANYSLYYGVDGSGSNNSEDVLNEILIGTANQYIKVNGGATGYTWDSLDDADMDFTGWTGVNSITTLGTIATGVWQATDIGVAYGGTGASTLNDLITLTTHTTGNYVTSITNGTGISGGDGGSEGAALTIAATLGTAIDTTEVTDDSLELVDFNNLNVFADEDVLTYETGTGGGFEGMTIAELLATTDTDSLPEGSSSFYANTEEEIEDFVGGMLGGTETHIAVTYQDGTNDIDFVVDPDSVAGAISEGALADSSVVPADIKDDTIEVADVNILGAIADEDILVYDTATGGGIKGLTTAELLATGSSTDLSDTADLLYEAELDAFSELQTQIGDKTVVNEEDAATWDALGTFDLGAAFKSGSTAAGFISIYEDSDDGTNFTKIQAIAQAGDITLTLPPDDGDAGEQLQTNGAGVMTWEAAGGGGATAWDDIGDPDNSGLTTITFDNAELSLLTGDNDAAASFLTIQNSDADHTGGNLYLLDLDYSADDGDADADFIKCQDSGSVVFSVQQDGETAMDGGVTSGGTIEGATITEGGVAVYNDNEMDAFSELDAIVADKALVNKADGAVWSGVHDFGGATSLELPNGTDPDVTVVGQISIDTDGGNEPNSVTLRTLEGDDQYLLADSVKTFQATVIKPNDLADATRDQCPIWSNESGMTFTITKIEAWSDIDDTTVNVEVYDSVFGNNATVDALEIANSGAANYYVTETTITAATIAANYIVVLDFDDTDEPGWVKISICGWFDANVN